MAEEKPVTQSSPDRYRWLVLTTVIVGTFLGRLDQTIVNLALPKIIQDFHITVSSAGWIATAYILANAVFVPIWGKLGDTIGRKKVYILGFLIFIGGIILGSILTAIAVFAGLYTKTPIARTVNQLQSKTLPKGKILEAESEELEDLLETLKEKA